MSEKNWSLSNCEKIRAVSTKCAKFIWKTLRLFFTLIFYVMNRIYNGLLFICRHRFFKKLCNATYQLTIVPLKMIQSVLPKTFGNRLSLLILIVMLLIYTNLPLNKMEKFGPIFFCYSFYYLIAVILCEYVDQPELDGKINKKVIEGKLMWTEKL
jgi:hypothetical protein